MAGAPGPVRRAWYQWKMQRFPWRKKWLVGFDLQGNTFWEFKDALHSLRNRRIAKYSRSTHYGDVQISPSWMQWLRHTRFDPPTIAEQQQDVARQERIKLLAAQADAKWAAKPSALDAPDKQQPVLPLQSQHPATAPSPLNDKQDIRHTPAPRSKKSKVKEPADSPWKQQAAQSHDWQPQGWTPAPAKRPS